MREERIETIGGNCAILRDELKFAIMSLTDKQLEYVLGRLQCLNQ